MNWVSAHCTIFLQWHLLLDCRCICSLVSVLTSVDQAPNLKKLVKCLNLFNRTHTSPCSRYPRFHLKLCQLNSILYLKQVCNFELLAMWLLKLCSLILRNLGKKLLFVRDDLSFMNLVLQYVYIFIISFKLPIRLIQIKVMLTLSVFYWNLTREPILDPCSTSKILLNCTYWTKVEISWLLILGVCTAD